MFKAPTGHLVDVIIRVKDIKLLSQPFSEVEGVEKTCLGIALPMASTGEFHNVLTEARRRPSCILP